MELNGVSASEDTLQFVIDAMSNMRRCGGITSDDEIWSTNDCIESTRLPTDHELLKPALRNAMVTLKRLEAATDVLNELARSSERTLEALRTQLRPSFLRHGIHSLPEETLGDIFRLVVDVVDKTRSVVGPELILSHVCRHFRWVALRLPSLWSRLDSRMPESRILQHLERSKGINLSIVIVECRWSSRLMTFIRLVTSYAVHWKSLQFECREPRETDPFFHRNLAKFLGNMDLPNLKSFKACVIGFEDFDFFKSWKMPKVCHISVSDAVSSFRPFSPEMITSLDVFWYKALPDLVDVPPSLPNLVDLRLHITTKLKDPINLAESGDPALILPRLRRFTLTIEESYILFPLMRCLRMPLLEKVFVQISANDDRFQTTEEWFAGIPSQAFDSVKELELRILRIEGDLYLSSIFKKFPGLQRLILAALQNEIELGPEDVTMPPLRSLLILGGLRPDFLREFIVRLERDERLDKFEYAKLNFKYVAFGSGESQTA